MFKALNILMVALIASTGAVQAQSLPGPAAGGWYVAIGENPFHVWKRSHPDTRLLVGPFDPPVCTAKVIRATDQLVITGEDPFEWMGDGKTGVDFVAEPKRFGPFPNEYAAEASLKNSGWSGSLTANIGCDLAQPAPRPANALDPCPKLYTETARDQVEALPRQACLYRTYAGLYLIVPDTDPKSPMKIGEGRTTAESVDAKIDEILKGRTPAPRVTPTTSVDVMVDEILKNR